MKPLLGALLALGALALLVGIGDGAAEREWPRMGRQADGGFLVSSGQRIEPGTIAFDYRPKDIALHPSGRFFAVLNQKSVLLATPRGVIAGSETALSDDAGYHGLQWTPDGERLLASVADGTINEFALEGQRLALTHKLIVAPSATLNPRPGGMAITRDGTKLFVAECDRNAVAQINLDTGQWEREYPVQQLPFDVKLSADEKTLIVSNWAGRPPQGDDEVSGSGNALIVVNPQGAAATGTVSLVEIATGKRKDVPVGLHPTALAVQGGAAYAACAADDSIAVVDIARAKVSRTIPIQWGNLHLFGAMPDALAVHGATLYVCNGGDNALCEVDLPSGKARGFRAAGYFPTAIALSADGETALVVNTKGNGSVRRTVQGKPGNAHDFQGTVSVIDLTSDLEAATRQVAANNHWNRQANSAPALAVYHGAIRHVLYIIKENRTYDEVFGDLPEGNGMKPLCDLGETITPNHHALARAFTLFDNGYVSGTNSADGHAWSTQSVANDYLEHFYDGYRTYPDDGDCAMSLSGAGSLWDAAAKAHLTIRNYGEYCDEDLATFTPQPKTWLDVWKDRQTGHPQIKVHVATLIPSLKPYTHPGVVYWPLLQSDQQRADLFIDEYQKNSQADAVPNLMLLSLPCDHTEGANPAYPKPQSMVADNDLALGRVVEAVSHSPQWKNTCIFVIEDDAQSGPDHVDGHRTVYMAFSPYVKRHYVSHEFGTTASMLRSLELMLGIAPMNRFDALAAPLQDCFSDAPNLAPFTSVPSRLALDDMNPPIAALSGMARAWAKQSLALNWSGPDRADANVLNRILWHSLHGGNVPFTLGRTPGAAADE